VRPLALLLGFLAAPLLSAGAQQAPHDSIRGAVRLVNVKARTLEVTAGVGMALRVVRLQVPAGMPVATRGGGGSATLTLRDLHPGDVVRVSYGARPGGYVAYTIERVGRMDAGLGSTP
jgi:hypothetical protein